MSARTREFRPTRQKRVAAIRDIVYEYANLVTAAYYSLNGQAPWRTHCDDAFLLGCRKLDDFLMQEKRSTKGGQELDDVLALDYLPSNTTRAWGLPIWIAEWRVAMNKQLAHIAYSRDKEWDHRIWIPQLVPEFSKAWLDFRAAIVDDEYNREFDKQLTACRGKNGFERIDVNRW